MRSKHSYTQQRQHPRFYFDDCPWTFALSLEEEKPFAPPPIRLAPQNISLGGLKFLSNHKFSVFQVLQVLLYPKNSKDSPIPLLAKIIRVEEIDTGEKEKMYGVASKFQEIPFSIQEKLMTAFSVLEGNVTES